eukprot:1483470-Pyramimonas_sp.AAC.1
MRVAVAGKSSRRRTDADADDGAGSDDDIETYRKKLGQWRQDVLTSLDSNEFWLGLRLGNLSREPITHLERWQEKKQNRKDEAKRSQKPDMLELVTEMAGEIDHQFDQLLDRPEWEFMFDPRSYDLMCGGIDVHVDSWVVLAVTCVVELATNYYHRIVLTCAAWPRRLMWLIYMPVDVPCDHRQSIALELLDETSSDLDLTTEKFRILFHAELKYAAHTKLLTPRLWDCLRDVARAWTTHTQERGSERGASDIRQPPM